MLYSMVLAIFVLPYTLAMPGKSVLLDQFEDETPRDLSTFNKKQPNEAIERTLKPLLRGPFCPRGLSQLRPNDERTQHENTLTVKQITSYLLNI